MILPYSTPGLPAFIIFRFALISLTIMNLRVHRNAERLAKEKVIDSYTYELIKTMREFFLQKLKLFAISLNIFVIFILCLAIDSEFYKTNIILAIADHLLVVIYTAALFAMPLTKLKSYRYLPRVILSQRGFPLIVFKRTLMNIFFSPTWLFPMSMLFALLEIIAKHMI